MTSQLNPCCCCTRLKDATISIAVWSTVYSVVQLVVFTWQMFAVAYERDRAANVPFPNYNSYGRPDVPYTFQGDWLTFEGRYYLALFIVQWVCLIVSVGLFFTSLGLFYGVHRVRMGVVKWGSLKFPFFKFLSRS